MKSFLLLICGVAALSACHKDADNGPAAPSRTDLLTAKNWRVTAQTITTKANGSVTVTDDYPKTLPCERDNFIKFNPDKTASNDAGSVKCYSGEPQSDTFSWAFDKDETHLFINTGSSPVVPDSVVELSATTLHLRQVSAGSVAEVRDITFTTF